MNFDSVFFLSCFLPLTALAYGLGRSRHWRNGVLLCAGVAFSAFGSLPGAGLLLLWAAGNFLLGRKLQKSRRKFWKILGISGNLVFLAGFKYAHFFLSDILGLTADWPVFLPLGLSFFTFKCISYLVDLAGEPEKAAKTPGEFFQYVFFFPQALSGPIARFDQFRTQLSGPRQMNPDGLLRFTAGLAKKVLLAAPLGELVDQIFGATVDGSLAWLGAVGYLLEIYLDFSGYSDMAIGLGTFFGFSTPENFQYPYTAQSLTDFWRRWHISLSAWFRDYVYIPLGGSRKGKARTAWNKFLVFTLCGVWHGANWTFLLWGVWHGLLTAAESLLPKKPRGAAGRVYTLLAVCLGFVMFRAASVGEGFAMLRALFAPWQGSLLRSRLLNGETLAVFLTSAAVCVPWKWGQTLRKSWAVYPLCLVLLALCLLQLAAGGFRPFIYGTF